jgi:hypothetical protein
VIPPSRALWTRVFRVRAAAGGELLARFARGPDSSPQPFDLLGQDAGEVELPGFVDTPWFGGKGPSTIPKNHRPYLPEFRQRIIDL